MSSRKRTRQQPTVLTSRCPLEELEAIDQLMRQRRWAAARELLQPLARQQPKHEGLLTRLVEACHELGDAQGYLDACERLSRMRPNDADLAAVLVGAYLFAEHPSLALRTCRRFL